MSPDEHGDGNTHDSRETIEPKPARAPRSRKSSQARIHPVDDPNAWRDAVLPDPDRPSRPAEGSE